MKTITIIAGVLCSTIMLAQPKYTSVYSSSNYKMPNNARIAKENNLDKTQTFNHASETKIGTESAANYKNTFSKSNGNGGELPILPIEIVVNPLASQGNYKSNFRGSSKAKKTEQLPVQQQPVVLLTPSKDANE